MKANLHPWAMALGAVLLASPAVWAAQTVQHAGTVTAVDTARHTITIEEMGPWHPGKTNLTHEVFVLTPATKVELAVRTDVASGSAAQWTEKPLSSSHLRRGDYATVTAERKAGTLEAREVVVVRPEGFGSHAGVQRH
jgi:hypothetical protein